MNWKNTLVAFCLLLFAFQAKAQDPPKKIEHSISGYLLPSALQVGVAYEYLGIPHLGIEGQLGFIGGGLGAKFYPLRVKKQRVTPYVGMTQYYWKSVFLSGMRGYYPIGGSYIWKSGFRVGVDVGPETWWYRNGDGNIVSEWYPGVSVRIGKAF